jgi:hypothetical protein
MASSKDEGRAIDQLPAVKHLSKLFLCSVLICTWWRAPASRPHVEAAR